MSTMLSMIDMRPYNGFKMPPFPNTAQVAWDRAVKMDTKIAAGVAVAAVLGGTITYVFGKDKFDRVHWDGTQTFSGILGMLSIACAVGNVIDRIFPVRYT